MLTSVALFVGLALAQIPDFGGKVQIEKMKKLEFMVGEWKGTGKFVTPDREIPTDSTESVAYAAGGTCLFVTGKHWIKGPNDQKVLIHDAAALIRWDIPTGKYRMRAQLANGLGNEFDLEVLDKGTVWGMESESIGGSRYVMRLTDKGEWFEIGERSTDGGKTWTKFMEMTLAKTP